MPHREDRLPQPRVRLLWDELLSPLVPKVLAVLGFRATYVGSDAGSPVPPPKGESDEVIVDFAQRTNQVIVTSNHDMMLICEQEGQRFVWLDPRGRQLSQREQVVLCLTQIEQWEDILNRSSGECVRALRTKATSIRAGEAARLAKERMIRLERKKRRNAVKRNKVGEHAQLDGT